MGTTTPPCESCGRQVVAVPTDDLADCFCDRCQECGATGPGVFEGLCDDCAEPGWGYDDETIEEPA